MPRVILASVLVDHSERGDRLLRIDTAGEERATVSQTAALLFDILVLCLKIVDDVVEKSFLFASQIVSGFFLKQVQNIDGLPGHWQIGTAVVPIWSWGQAQMKRCGRAQ